MRGANPTVQRRQRLEHVGGIRFCPWILRPRLIFAFAVVANAALVDKEFPRHGHYATGAPLA